MAFGKKWRVTIDTIATDAHDLTFEVVKTVKRAPNRCSLSIYNLTGEQREHLESLSVYKHKKKKGSGSKGKSRGPRGHIPVSIEAGYQDEGTSLLFRGDLRVAMSERQGPDIVTTIEGEDGGRSMLESRVSRSFPPGTPVAAVVRACVEALGLGAGNSASLAYTTRSGGTFPAGTTLQGQAHEELTGVLRSCGMSWSVQNGAVQILQAGQPLAISAVRLSADTGLVETPTVDPYGIVHAKALLVPGLFPGGRVQLEPNPETVSARGLFQITAVRYRGDTKGEWVAELECRP